MMGMGFVGVVESPYAAIALLSLGGFAHQTLSVTVITMSSDLFKRSEVATVAGMAGTFGNAGLLIFSLLIGGLVATVGYTPFFVGLAVLDLAGAALLLWWDPLRVGEPSQPRRHARSPPHDLKRRHHPQPDPAGFQPGPVDRARRRRLLRRDLDVRVVPGRADPPLARPGALAAADAAARAGQPAQHARRPGLAAASGRRA